MNSPDFLLLSISFYNRKPKWGVQLLGIASLAAYLKERDINVDPQIISLPLSGNQSKNILTKPIGSPNCFSIFTKNPDIGKIDKTFLADLVYARKHIDLWAKVIKKKNYKTIGLSIFLNNLFISLVFAKEIKKSCPDIKIILEVLSAIE